VSISTAIDVLDRIRVRYIEHAEDCSLYVRTSIVEFANVLIWWLRREKVDEFNILVDGYLSRCPGAMSILMREMYTEMNCASRQELTDFLRPGM